jgi:hypothetical protein
MDFLTDNWAGIAASIPLILAALGAIAELTPMDWDNKLIKMLRQLWAKVPVFSRNANTMGRPR